MDGAPGRITNRKLILEGSCDTSVESTASRHNIRTIFLLIYFWSVVVKAKCCRNPATIFLIYLEVPYTRENLAVEPTNLAANWIRVLIIQSSSGSIFKGGIEWLIKNSCLVLHTFTMVPLPLNPASSVVLRINGELYAFIGGFFLLVLG